MKIVIFGASRGTGLKVVEQALQRGHFVTAFVRSPDSFSMNHPNLTILQGDSTNTDAVANAIAGKDAVISTLAPTRPPVPHMMETSAKNIVAGMYKHEVRRIVSTTGAGVRQPEDRPKAADLAIGFLLNLLVKDVVLDSAANVKVIQSSTLDWTIVRFPRLTNGAPTGKYRVGYVSQNSGTQISRADAADFILKELEAREWLGKFPVVSY